MITCILLTSQSEMQVVKQTGLEEGQGSYWPDSGTDEHSLSLPISEMLRSLRAPWTGAVERPPHPLLPIPGASNPTGALSRGLGLYNNGWASFLWIKGA